MSIAATIADTRTAGSKMRSIVFASSVGTIIEWYDFLIYATAAALVFNKAFFPTIDPLAGTLAALGTYAYGIESFEDLTADRILSLGATTITGGVRIDLPSLTRITTTWEHQWRSNSTSIDRFTVSVIQTIP